MGDKTTGHQFPSVENLSKYTFFKHWGLEMMFNSNLKLSNYCASQLESYPKFYQNLIQLWAEVSEEEPKVVSEICEEII